MKKSLICSVCRSPLVDRKVTVTVSGKCSNRGCACKTQETKLRVMEYLDMKPYSHRALLDLPEGTPVWVEIRTKLPGQIIYSDIVEGWAHGEFQFLSGAALTEGDYDDTCRAWPTFKTWKPSGEDLFDAAWKNPNQYMELAI